MTYQWRNPKTGKIKETDSYDTPPAKGWTRVYSFSLGPVLGGGSSPSRYVRGDK